MQYPSLPIYVPAPKSAAVSYPTLPQLAPRFQTQSQFVMPVRHPIYYTPSTLQAMTVSQMVLAGFSGILCLWMVVFIMCNAATFVQMLKHSDMYVIMVVAYFAISTVVKLTSGITGLAAVFLTTSTSTWLNGLAITLTVMCVVCTVGFWFFVTWSWSHLSMGTNIAFIVEALIHIEVCVHSLILTSSSSSVSAFRYVLVAPTYQQP